MAFPAQTKVGDLVNTIVTHRSDPWDDDEKMTYMKIPEKSTVDLPWDPCMLCLPTVC